MAMLRAASSEAAEAPHERPLSDFIALGTLALPPSSAQTAASHAPGPVSWLPVRLDVVADQHKNSAVAEAVLSVSL